MYEDVSLISRRSSDSRWPDLCARFDALEVPRLSLSFLSQGRGERVWVGPSDDFDVLVRWQSSVKPIEPSTRYLHDAGSSW